MIRQLVPTSASVTTNVGAHVRKIILSASLLLQINTGPIVLAQFEYEVKERTISRADGTTRPLDLSPETIRRAVRAVEAERATFHQDHSGRRPGVDGPWASGSGRARNARIAALRVMTIDANDKATCRRVAQEIASSDVRPARAEDALENLCNDPKRKGNLARIIVMENQDPNEFQVNLDASFLTNTDRKLANDTRNLAIGMAGTMGALWAMPGTVTGWDKEKIRSNPDGLFATIRCRGTTENRHWKAFGFNGTRKRSDDWNSI